MSIVVASMMLHFPFLFSRCSLACPKDSGECYWLEDPLTLEFPLKVLGPWRWFNDTYSLVGLWYMGRWTLVHLEICPFSVTLRPSFLLRGVLQVCLDLFGAGGEGGRPQDPGAGAADGELLSAPDTTAGYCWWLAAQDLAPRRQGATSLDSGAWQGYKVEASPSSSPPWPAQSLSSPGSSPTPSTPPSPPPPSSSRTSLPARWGGCRQWGEGRRQRWMQWPSCSAGQLPPQQPLLHQRTCTRLLPSQKLPLSWNRHLSQVEWVRFHWMKRIWGSRWQQAAQTAAAAASAGVALWSRSGQPLIQEQGWMNRNFYSFSQLKCYQQRISWRCFIGTTLFTPGPIWSWTWRQQLVRPVHSAHWAGPSRIGHDCPLSIAQFLLTPKTMTHNPMQMNALDDSGLL